MTMANLTTIIEEENGMYEKIEKIQEMLWRNDDLMRQETLFELQDYVADLLLKVAEKEGKVDELVAEYPWLYRTVEEAQ